MFGNSRPPDLVGGELIDSDSGYRELLVKKELQIYLTYEHQSFNKHVVVGAT